MFGRRKQTEGAPAPEAAAEEADAAVDTLADVLRALGEFSFDTAEMERAEAAERFEAWARHLLVGSDPPEGASGEVGSRDWAGVRRFATSHRKEESKYVSQSLADLREALWVFVNGLGRSLPADRKCEAEVGGELDRLRTTLESNDTEEIRRAARASIRAVEDALRQRAERTEHTIEQLSSRVEKFSQQLVEAREQLERDALTRLYNRGSFDEFLEKNLRTVS